jgi:hypothetical protein
MKNKEKQTKKTNKLNKPFAWTISAIYLIIKSLQKKVDSFRFFVVYCEWCPDEH